jgi:tetratricopeptide (TPR) repeat protein
VLRGDPKSGKSRSLWEAVRTLPGRNLLAVAYPDTVAATADPAFEPLTALAGLDRPVSRSQGRDLVIWVDDAHRHLQRGLTRNTLRRLAALYPKAVIAMTIHSHELDGLRNIDPDLHARLRRHFDVLLLSPRLSPHELASARSAYPSLADDPDLKRLPELFAAVNLLIDRYQHHRADEPAGVAVAKAAIDWQRAGMPPGSIDEPTLRALAGLVLADIAPNQDLDDWAFKHGLTWAREESAVFAALVRRDPASSSQVQRFRAFDAVVSWAHHHDAPIDHKTWSFVLANARNRDLLSVGISAYMTGEWDLAIDAFQQAARSTNPSVAAGALIGKAVALEQVGRYEDELAAYDEIVERFDDAEDPALSQHVATALSRKGSRRRQLDHLGAQAADEQVSQQAETTVAPNDAIRIIHLLTEDFMLLHLRSQVEAFRARWPALSDHSPDELALLRPTAPEVPGLGYARTHEIDGIVGVIAWSVTARAALHSRDSRAGRVGRERNRIRRVADKRHLRPEVSDALARFLTDRLDDEIPQCGPDEDIRGRSGSRGRGRPWGRT